MARADEANCPADEGPWVSVEIRGASWLVQLEPALLSDLKARLRIEGLEACPAIARGGRPPQEKAVLTSSGPASVRISLRNSGRVRNVTVTGLPPTARAVALARNLSEMLRAIGPPVSSTGGEPTAPRVASEAEPKTSTPPAETEPDAAVPSAEGEAKPGAASGLAETRREAQPTSSVAPRLSLGVRTGVQQYLDGFAEIRGGAVLRLSLDGPWALEIGVDGGRLLDAQLDPGDLQGWALGGLGRLSFALIPTSSAGSFGLESWVGSQFTHRWFSTTRAADSARFSTSGSSVDAVAGLSGIWRAGQDWTLVFELQGGYPVLQTEIRAPEGSESISGARGIVLGLSLGARYGL